MLQSKERNTEYRREWRRKNRVLDKIQWTKDYKKRKKKPRKISEETRLKNLERAKKWKQENKERIREIERARYLKKKEKEFKALVSLMKYERSESRMEKKRINQRAYVERKKSKNGTIDADVSGTN